MFADINHIHIHYEVFGEGKPVLLLHGLGCGLELMTGCMEPIFQKLAGYRRIYVDLPGMGRSDPPPGPPSSDSILETLLAFIGHLKLDRFLLAGESYGGYLAQGILASLPQRAGGLFLLCPVVEPEAAHRNLPAKNVRLYDYPFLERLAPEEREVFCEYAVIADGQTYERYRQDIVPGLQRSNLEWIGALKSSYRFSPGIKNKMEGLSYPGPVLILTGRQDQSVGYKDQWRILQNYPRATFAVLDLAGHNLQIEQPELLACFVQNWIARIEAPGEFC